MDFFNIDPNIRRVPPGEMRFVTVHAHPETDGKTIRVTLEVTPFQYSPYIDLFINDPHGKLAASTSIIEPANWKMEFFLHPRKADDFTGKYFLSAVLYHPKYGEIDYRRVAFSVPDGKANDAS